MKKLFVATLLFISIKAHAFASSDSTNLVNTKVPSTVSSERKKNNFILQFLGETPTIGIMYKRRVFENDSWMTEVGLGVGFKPTNNADRTDVKVSNFTYSHTITFIKKTERSVEPSIGYSGILFSGLYNKGKVFNYLPGVNFGLSLKLTDNSKIGFGLLTCLAQSESYALQGENILIHLRSTKVQITPLINCQLYF